MKSKFIVLGSKNQNRNIAEKEPKYDIVGRKRGWSWGDKKSWLRL